MTRVAQTEGVRLVEVSWGSMTFFLLLECSFCFPDVLGVEVDNAQDNYWRGRFTMWLYLVAKPSHIEGRCRRASLSSPPAYGPYLPHEGTGPSA
jgi:hypothetical protein